MYLLFGLFLILACVLLVLVSKYYSSPVLYTQLHTQTYTQPYLFAYWELKPGHDKIPDYISLCFESMRKNGYLFNLTILNEKTVHDYLPNIRTDINELPLALKTDYIRVALLHKFGGLWLDADTIMITNMQPVVDLLNQNTDYIGFGCTGETCTYGYGRPSNGVMAATKGSVLMGECLDALNKKLDKYFSDKSQELNYFDLGKLIIWDCIDKLQASQNYKYYHFSSYVDGTRDKAGNWIAPDVIFEKDFDVDTNKLLFMMLANSYYCGNDTKYNWFCGKTKSEILNSNYYVSKIFRLAL